MRRSQVLCILTLALLTPLLASTPLARAADETPHQTIDQELGEAIRRANVAPENVAVLIAPIGTTKGKAKPLIRWRAGAPMNPASTIKVLTSAAALEALGPSYRFKTGLYFDGSLKSGELQGNLYIKGSGDPSMVSEQLWRLVTDLRNRSVEKIRGDLIGDDTLLESTAWRGDFDQGTSSNSANGALSLNYNHLQIWVQPRALGESPKVVFDPPVGGLIKINNQARTISGSGNSLAADMSNGGEAMRLEVRGTIGDAAKPVQFYRAVANPTRYFLEAFKAMFIAAGGSIDGTVRVAKVPPQAQLLYEKESEAFLSQILILLNKYSNNFIAEQLVMTLGTQGGYQGSGVHQRGLQFLGQFLTKVAPSSAGALILSGSGLSKKSRLSAEQLNAVLAYTALQGRSAPELAASLRIFGDEGKMKLRPNAQKLGATVRVKSGSIDNVMTLVGYATLEPNNLEKPPLVFSILVNQPGVTIEAMRPFQNELLELAVERYRQVP